jgi:hypothetical protein
MKVVINACHGGFGLSQKAMQRYAELKGFKLITEDRGLYSIYYADSVSDDNLICNSDIPRNDPDLVQVVEELGTAANSWSANLGIVEIPEGISWDIEEYDGFEWVAESHRTWR